MTNQTTPFDSEPTADQLTGAFEFVRRSTRPLPGYNEPASAVWEMYAALAKINEVEPVDKVVLNETLKRFGRHAVKSESGEWVFPNMEIVLDDPTENDLWFSEVARHFITRTAFDEGIAALDRLHNLIECGASPDELKAALEVTKPIRDKLHHVGIIKHGDGQLEELGTMLATTEHAGLIEPVKPALDHGRETLAKHQAVLDAIRGAA
jgi:hypothetical protein